MGAIQITHAVKLIWKKSWKCKNLHRAANGWREKQETGRCFTQFSVRTFSVQKHTKTELHFTSLAHTGPRFGVTTDLKEIAYLREYCLNMGVKCSGRAMRAAPVL